MDPKKISKTFGRKRIDIWYIDNIDTTDPQFQKAITPVLFEDDEGKIHLIDHRSILTSITAEKLDKKVEG